MKHKISFEKYLDYQFEVFYNNNKEEFETLDEKVKACRVIVHAILELNEVEVDWRKE